MTKRLREAAHSLKEQLAAFVSMAELLEKREAALKQPWAATVDDTTEAEAAAKLKIWQDKWNRNSGELL